VGPRAGMTAMGKANICGPPGIEPSPPFTLVRSLVTLMTGLSQLSAKRQRHVNSLTPELNPSAQRCLTRFFTGDFASLNTAFRKYMHETPTNATIIHSVYYLYMIAPTCFGIILPSSGSVASAFVRDAQLRSSR
jgi:hypothetical protein